MTKETLSDKIQEHGRVGREWYRLDPKDVREFIQKLKEEVDYLHLGASLKVFEIETLIDTLAGKELANHSPQELTSKKVILNSDLNLTASEDTVHQKGCGCLIEGTEHFVCSPIKKKGFVPLEEDTHGCGDLIESIAFTKPFTCGDVYGGKLILCPACEDKK